MTSVGVDTAWAKGNRQRAQKRGGIAPPLLNNERLKILGITENYSDSIAALERLRVCVKIGPCPRRPDPGRAAG